MLSEVVGKGVPIAFEAFDGSSAGPSDALCRIVIKDPRALNHVATAPSDLGLARAYVAGYLDVDGDIFTALELLSGEHVASLSVTDRLEVLRRLGLHILKPVSPPPEELRPGLWWGLRHSMQRDSKAISHHYDVSNRFYEWLLGPSMAYTCAVYPSPAATLEEAQEEKVDLVCRKLDLQPGQRLLDVGCGWGTMVLHAAKHYRVKVLGVTLSGQQAEWGRRTIVEQGLSDLAEIRHDDYRNVSETGFDAISSIGMTEHIGAKNVPGYAKFLASKVRPQGRFLNHCITRPITTAPARSRRLHQPLRVPRRGARRSWDGDIRDTGQRFRSPSRGELPGALRAHLRRVGGQSRSALGRGRGRGRRGDRQGVASLFSRFAARFRPAPHRVASGPRGAHGGRDIGDAPRAPRVPSGQGDGAGLTTWRGRTPVGRRWS